MQKGFYFCGDVMVRGYYPGYARKIWRSLNLDPKFFEKDTETLAEGKMDFFTYSYYQSGCFTTHEDDVDMSDEGEGALAHSRKDSFHWYQRVIETNGEDLG